MQHNCNFDKVSLLIKLRGIIWRIDKYVKDAEITDHPLCKAEYLELKADLERHSKKLEAAIVGLAKEDKFGFCEKC